MPGEAFVFTKSLNWLLALGATVTVANLYVVQPILVELAVEFQVDYEQVTRIPSLLQGGYLVGSVHFLCEPREEQRRPRSRPAH